MPVCTLFLLSLKQNASIPSALQALKSSNVTPLFQSCGVRWIILPTKTSSAPLLAHNHRWDLLLVFLGEIPLPSSLSPLTNSLWNAVLGVPSRIVSTFKETNSRLLNPPPGTVNPAGPYLSNSSTSQSLELSPELATWIHGQPSSRRLHPVAMLNLLKFKDGSKDAYIKYGQEFAKRAGSRHGGNAKIVAHVVGGQAKKEGWDEVAIAHYPSMEHFAGMLASEEYQEVNHKYRLGALEDTFIFCTQEVDEEGALAGKLAPESASKL